MFSKTSSGPAHLTALLGGIVIRAAAVEWQALAGSERSLVVVSTDKYSFVQLDDEAAQRRDQRSFHWFAEWAHSGVRGQVLNLEAGGEIKLPHDDCPRHVFMVTGIDGAVDALLEEKVFPLRAHSRLVVLPGTLCTLRARSAASIELTGFISTPPPSTG